MTNQDKPIPPAHRQPGEVPSDVPEADPMVEVPETDGPLPGLPPVTDPLLQPTPRPDKREVPPLD